MKKYQIDYSTTLYFYVTVEAEDENQARKIADSMPWSSFKTEYDTGAIDFNQVAELD